MTSENPKRKPKKRTPVRIWQQIPLGILAESSQHLINGRPLPSSLWDCHFATFEKDEKLCQSQRKFWILKCYFLKYFRNCDAEFPKRNSTVKNSPEKTRISGLFFNKIFMTLGKVSLFLYRELRNITDVIPQVLGNCWGFWIFLNTNRVELWWV